MNRQQLLFWLLTAVNGVSVNEIYQKMLPMLGRDNTVYRNRKFLQTFYIYEILAHYGGSA